MSSKKHKVSARLNLLNRFRVPRQVTDQAIGKFLESLDCPRSLMVHMLYKYGEHEQLVQLEADPVDYIDWRDFRDAYAATALLSKSKFLNLEIDRKAEALKKFYKFELQCRETNRRFRNLSASPLYKGRSVWLLHATRRKILQILGDFSLEELLDSTNWGPGVSLLIKSDTSKSNKFQREVGITRDLFHYLNLHLVASFPRWAENLVYSGFPVFHPGNSVTTVDKTAKIDRVIAVEPGINLFVQKGIGLMIRRRLKRYGVDLNTQEVNQRLARTGSIYQSYATIDFSSASDSIARIMVQDLFSESNSEGSSLLPWFEAMEASRSPFGIIDGKPLLWEKFSSMGNGFTFELESLIFFAAALALKELMECEGTSISGQISVYGDDVILPSSMSAEYLDFCTFLGFSPNLTKTFVSGPFRESCGSYYFEGSCVKPIFLKDKLFRAETIYGFANAVRQFSNGGSNRLPFCDRRFAHAFYWLASRLPKTLRFKVPFGFPTGGFVSNFDEATPSKARHWIEGYSFECVTAVSPQKHAIHFGHLLAKLFELERRRSVVDATSSKNIYSVRGPTVLRVVRPLVSQWYDLGPWI